MVLNLLNAELRRTWAQLVRYPTEFVSEMLMMLLIFYGLFLGGNFMAGGHISGNHLSDVIVGYLLWMVVLGAMGNMGYTISEEASSGTLEQLFLSPMSSIGVFLIRSIDSLFYTIVSTGVLLYCIMLITNHYLDLSFGELVPFFMAIAVSIGIGYLIGSVAIVFKRVNQLFSILQFVLMFLIMIPFSQFTGILRDLMYVVPLAPMTGLLTMMSTTGTGLAEHGTLIIAGIVNLILWITIGVGVFNFASRAARKRGTLGHY